MAPEGCGVWALLDCLGQRICRTHNSGMGDVVVYTFHVTVSGEPPFSYQLLWANAKKEALKQLGEALMCGTGLRLVSVALLPERTTQGLFEVFYF